MGGWGVITRDSVGNPIFAAAGRVHIADDALQTELMSLVHAIPMVVQLGVGRPIFLLIVLSLRKLWSPLLTNFPGWDLCFFMLSIFYVTSRK
jgi:hypothetical protein